MQMKTPMQAHLQGHSCPMFPKYLLKLAHMLRLKSLAGLWIYVKWLFYCVSCVSHTLTWLWCSVPVHLSVCLWIESLRLSMKRWCRPCWPESRSTSTCRGRRVLSPTCSECSSSCPWSHGSRRSWSSPEIRLISKNILLRIQYHQSQLKRGQFIQFISHL